MVGDFNNWSPSENLLRRHPDGVWRGNAAAARPGDEYMFLLDGHLERRDPRAREVSRGGRCVIPPPSPTPSSHPAPEPAQGLVMYQMHIGTFHDPDPGDSNPGTLDDAVKKLDHLRDLGVNCVLLMPVNEFSGDRSWGYNPKDMFAIESAYGGPRALRRFVRECHRRGIAVHVDIVHNHYGPEDLHLWDFDTAGKSPPSPHSPRGIYFYRDDERGETPWGPRPNFGKKEVSRFVSDQVRMWFDEYGIDGLRWDSTVNIRALRNGLVPNPEGERLLDRVSRMIRREYPGKTSIAEDSLGDRRFDASWDYDFHHDARGGVVENLVRRRPSEVDVSDIAQRLESELGFGRVVYAESHDEVGLLNSKTRLLSEADPDDPLSTKARRTAALAAVLVLTSPSIPMIFMGQELGQTGPFHDNIPLDWGVCAVRGGMLPLYRDLIRLRRGSGGLSSSLQSPKIRIMLADDEQKLLVYRRHIPSLPESDIVIAMNLGDLPTSRSIPVPAPGKWHTVFSTETPTYGLGVDSSPSEVEAGSDRLLAKLLPPRSAVVLARNPLAPSTPPVPPVPSESPASSPSPSSEPSPLPAAAVADANLSASPQGGSVTSSELETPTPEPESLKEFYVSANFTDPPFLVGRQDLRMNGVEEGIWQIDLALEVHAGSSAELLVAAPSTGFSFGVGHTDQSPSTLPISGSLTADGPPIVLEGPIWGSYRLTFDDRTMRFRLEFRAETGLDRVNILSSENGWNRQSDPMYMIGDYLWQLDIPTYPEDEVEFVVSAGGDLSRQWGAWTGESPPVEWSGPVEHLGPPVKVKATTEAIRVTFDERKGEIRVRPLAQEEIPDAPSAPPPRTAPEANHLPPPEPAGSSN